MLPNALLTIIHLLNSDFSDALPGISQDRGGFLK